MEHSVTRFRFQFSTVQCIRVHHCTVVFSEKNSAQSYCTVYTSLHCSEQWTKLRAVLLYSTVYTSLHCSVQWTKLRAVLLYSTVYTSLHCSEQCTKLRAVLLYSVYSAPNFVQSWRQVRQICLSFLFWKRNRDEKSLYAVPFKFFSNSTASKIIPYAIHKTLKVLTYLQL